MNICHTHPAIHCNRKFADKVSVQMKKDNYISCMQTVLEGTGNGTYITQQHRAGRCLRFKHETEWLTVMICHCQCKILTAIPKARAQSKSCSSGFASLMTFTDYMSPLQPSPF